MRTRFSHPDGNRPPAGTGRRALRGTAIAAGLEAAASYPFILIYAVYILHAPPLGLLLLMALGHWGGGAAGTRQSEGAGPHSAAVLLAAVCVVSAAAYGLGPAGAAGAAALFAAALRGLIAGRKRLWAGVLARIPLTGIGAAFLLYGYIAGSKPAGLLPHRGELYLLCMITLFALLLRWNAERVRAAALVHGAESQTPGRIAAVNRRLTWLTLIPVAVIGAWQGLGPLLLAISRWLLPLLLPETQQPKPESPASAPAAMPGFSGAEDAAGSPLWLKMIGYVLLAALGLAVSAAVALLLYRLVSKWIPERIRLWAGKLIRGILRLRMLRRPPGEEPDYKDEVEKIERAASEPRRQRVKVKEKPLPGDDPRLAYRLMIRRAVKRGYVFRPSRTPAENGEELRENGRYTGLTPEEVNRLIRHYNAERYGKPNG